MYSEVKLIYCVTKRKVEKISKMEKQRKERKSQVENYQDKWSVLKLLNTWETICNIILKVQK